VEIEVPFIELNAKEIKRDVPGPHWIACIARQYRAVVFDKDKDKMVLLR